MIVCSFLGSIHPGRGSLMAADAYRMGDAVDTDVSMDGFLWDALRSQMPKFGINTKVHFEMEIPDDSRRYSNFCLLFGDGLRSIETRPFHNWRKEYLERVIIGFVYSKSGTGVIHSVSSTAVYKPTPTNAGRFRVEYEWQEEEAVRLTVGSAVMFLAVFLSSIVFLFHTCGLTDGPESSDNDYDHSSSYSDHKKW
jgi:hypothetical protein